MKQCGHLLFQKSCKLFQYWDIYLKNDILGMFLGITFALFSHMFTLMNLLYDEDS